MAVKRTMTGAQRCLLQALLDATDGTIEWPKKPFRDATLHALQEKKWARWFTSGDRNGRREYIEITTAGKQALYDYDIPRAESEAAR